MKHVLFECHHTSPHVEEFMAEGGEHRDQVTFNSWWERWARSHQAGIDLGKQVGILPAVSHIPHLGCRGKER